MEIHLSRFLCLALCCAALPDLQADGGPGYALRFDGSDDRVEVGVNPFPAITDTFTIELWVNPTGSRALTEEGNTGIAGLGQRFAVFPDHGAGYAAGHAGTGLSIGTNGISVFEHDVNYLPSLLVYPIAISGWTHVALVYFNRFPMLYVNGVLVRTGFASVKVVHPSANLGGSSQGIGYGNYQGDIDEVRIWDVALSPAQIQSNMNRSLTGAEPHLVVYYRCDEGDETTLIDSAPGSPLVNGTKINGTAWAPSGVQPFSPFAQTLPATAMGAITNTLNGRFNPAGTNTSAWFEWGTTTNYGNLTPTRAIGSGVSGTNLSEVLPGVTVGVTYHFRAVASNAFGVALGSNLSFSTPVFADINAGLPGVFWGSAATWGDFDNDGDLDILLTGSGEAGYIARVYRNDGSGTFTDINAGLPDGIGSVEWGDFDNDGDLDILRTRGTISLVYRNNGNGTFTDINMSLPGVTGGYIAWGDFDSDGDLDILLTGSGSIRMTRAYRNEGNGTFTEIPSGLPDISESSVEWGDFDNDGDLDILLTGYTGTYHIVRVYRNDGQGTFSDINANLPEVTGSSVAWGDFDNDGRLDILLAGYWAVLGYPIVLVYRNNGNGTFSNINADLPGVSAGSAAWGDFDNDGKLDILLTGATNTDFHLPAALFSRVCRNNGNGTFTDITAGLPGVYFGSVGAWGDFDNDGKLDILLTGATRSLADAESGTAPITRVYRNLGTSSNTAPSSPGGLTVAHSGNAVAFSWNASVDAETPAAGLSYNLRIGTTPGGSDLVSPMASSDGFSRLPQYGNAQQARSRRIYLPLGEPIYWSVQAVDTAFAGSPFATEQSFALNFTPPGGTGTPGDLNADGIVSEAELNTVLSNYFANSPFLQMTNVAGLGGTNVSFALTNSLAGAFSVEYTTNLLDWLSLGLATPRHEFTDTNAPAGPQRYYRLRWP